MGARVWEGRRRILPALLVLFACVAPAARAQSTTLSLTGAPSAATPTITDYANGYVCAGSVTWTATANSGKNQGKRTDSVFVRIAASSPMPSTLGGVTKALADFQYNTSGVGCSATSGWLAIPPLATPPALLGSSTNYNTSFTGTVFFRLVLDWTRDRGGATFTLPPLDFFLNRSQTTPP